MKKLWFVRKTYGWGWTPATWQGWLVILIFVGLMALNVLRIQNQLNSENDIIFIFIPQTFVLVFILLLITYATGETPRWQWGNKTTQKDHDKNH